MDHPIENMMRTTMESLKDMVDVNTVVGEPVETGNGDVVIPISRVSFGFVAGGGEYSPNAAQTAAQGDKPFGGGAGAGVSVCPMGFLVVSENGVRMLPAYFNTAVDRLIELAPQALCELRKWCQRQNAEPQTTEHQAQPDQMSAKDEL